MSPEIKQSIKMKMTKLEQFVKLLEHYKKELTLKEFKKNYDKHYAVMHLLTLSIEAITDIGAYILSQGYHESYDNYKDIIDALAQKKIISPGVAKKSNGMTNFRNLLIHIYEKIELGKVYLYLQDAPDLFRQYAKSFQKYLDKLEKNN